MNELRMLAMLSTYEVDTTTADIFAETLSVLRERSKRSKQEGYDAYYVSYLYVICYINYE
jgi:hypothetical protein